MSASVVEHALDGLPEPHRQLWLHARLIVKLSASRYYLAGYPMTEVLAVIADAGTLIAEVVERFFHPQVVHRESQAEPLIAVLFGDHALRLLMNFPSAVQYRQEIPKHGFMVLTAPGGCRPGVSVCHVVERRRLN